VRLRMQPTPSNKRQLSQQCKWQGQRQPPVVYHQEPPHLVLLHHLLGRPGRAAR